MVRTKDQFDKCGTISKIASNGMGIFTYEDNELQVAEKCAIGDFVVKPKGKARPFYVIPAEEWTSMPSTEKESKTTKASKETPQLADILKRLDSAESRAEVSETALKALQEEVAAGKTSGADATAKNDTGDKA